ncbi:hypothetical protein SUDANB105_00257 [Streptomyces sp. enrichment culture]
MARKAVRAAVGGHHFANRDIRLHETDDAA